MNAFWKKISIPGIILLGIGIFYQPIYELIHLSLREPLYSHILLIPVVSSYLIWVNRELTFSVVGSSPIAGTGLLSISILLTVFHRHYLGLSNPNDALFVAIASMLLWIFGGFLLIFGRQCFTMAMFPLLFLAFMLPIPTLILDPAVRFLQLGSVEATHAILNLLNIPTHREGVFISLPGITVKVAKECSGIRSALALLVLCTAASYVFLKSKSRRIILILAMVPVTIVKNGMRITTLSLLGSYVDMAYITDSALHSYGGKPFFVVAVIMMSPILWVLRRSEVKAGQKKDGNEMQQKALVRSTEISKDAPVVH